MLILTPSKADLARVPVNCETQTLGQPLVGAVAYRFGVVRVLSVGAILYAAGLAMMAYTTSPLTLQITAGVLIGFGLSGCSFNLVIAAFGKLLPERYRAIAIGAGTA